MMVAVSSCLLVGGFVFMDLFYVYMFASLNLKYIDKYTVDT